jgi:hypothetical protein
LIKDTENKNIEYVKKKAKKLKKDLQCKHHEALDMVCKSMGYSNWKHFLNDNKEGK